MMITPEIAKEEENLKIQKHQAFQQSIDRKKHSQTTWAIDEILKNGGRTIRVVYRDFKDDYGIDYAKYLNNTLGLDIRFDMDILEDIIKQYQIHWNIEVIRSWFFKEPKKLIFTEK